MGDEIFGVVVCGTLSNFSSSSLVMRNVGRFSELMGMGFDRIDKDTVFAVKVDGKRDEGDLFTVTMKSSEELLFRIDTSDLDYAITRLRESSNVSGYEGYLILNESVEGMFFELIGLVKGGGLLIVEMERVCERVGYRVFSEKDDRIFYEGADELPCLLKMALDFFAE